MATLETSIEANYDTGRTDTGQKKQLIGARATALPKKAYYRLSMITKLKYVGVSQEDLINIYILFIRSVTEYCSVSFHSSLTQKQSDKLERIQKTCLRVILGDHYIDYPSALEIRCLQTLFEGRATRSLYFAKRSINHPTN